MFGLDDDNVKNLFSKKEKSDMLKTAIQRPEDFEKYALNDLKIHRVLIKNAALWQRMYEAFGIEKHFVAPKLTIGATVKDFFEAVLLKRLGLESRKSFETVKAKFIIPASAKHLRENPFTTGCLISKVEGGRCRNNRSTSLRVEGSLCDIDLSGCYAEGLRNQGYPIGVPFILEFDSRSEIKFPTLREFLDKYGGELVPGLWVARVRTEEKLVCAQDFLASWFVPSVGDDLLKLGKYLHLQKEEEGEFDIDDGMLKIFNCEIKNGVITHDFLDWLFKVASTRQRNELLSKIKIKAAALYPKSLEIKDKTPEEALAILEKEVTSWYGDKKGKGKGKKRSKKETKTPILRPQPETENKPDPILVKKHELFSDGKYHGWFQINLGSLLVDELLIKRREHQIIDGKKSPFDRSYKLCCNTVYGDLTSRFFDISNVIVGNNITARARAMIWYVEKGLNTFQSITDGGVFELNRVVYPKDKDHRINGENVVNLFRLSQREAQIKRHIRFAPLGGCDEIKTVWTENEKGIIEPSLELTQTIDGVRKVTRLNNKESQKWVNETAMAHLRTLFPDVDVLHQPTKRLIVYENNGSPEHTFTDRIGMFDFEMKDFYTTAVFHGTANYLLESPKEKTIKMRSYQTSRPHESVGYAEICDLGDGDGNENRVLCVTTRYDDKNNPAVDFMEQLLKNKERRLERQEVFIKENILKLNDYKNLNRKYKALGITVGDSKLSAGLLREFSLSQFTFPTYKHYVTWDKTVTRLKNKYGQSLECFFTNDDGTLDYKSMIETIDKIISTLDIGSEPECPTIFLSKKYKGKAQRNSSDKEHPAFKIFLETKELLGSVEDECEDFDFN